MYVKYINHWVPVAHVYNPSYSGDRDQEDQSSRPAWAHSSQDPRSTNDRAQQYMLIFQQHEEAQTGGSSSETQSQIIITKSWQNGSSGKVPA
jgi:hypothetical protein